eukprot:TRINITY_DN18017_c0_g3_i2.p1 TRINITY_DN18017_c0_g3~~TRINITY_DN18017_c0_g3_i2.p1  ORF type:complete len:252 (-),score=39.66 TRINITY_DN18017_c0_g3_i2:73-828(-)
MLLPPTSRPYWLPSPGAPPTALASLTIASGGLLASLVAGWRGVQAVRARRAKGLPSVDVSDLRVHDAANIAALSVILGLNAAALAGKGGRLFTFSMCAYLSLDTLWVLLNPACVPSPTVVLPHHALTLALLLHPVRYPEHNGFGVLVTTVEAQTLVLVVRRHFESELRRRPRLQLCMSLVYWATTLVTRMFLHPVVLVDSFQRLRSTPAEMFLTSGGLLLLCIFNVLFVTKDFKKLLADRRKHPQLDGKES